MNTLGALIDPFSLVDGVFTLFSGIGYLIAWRANRFRVPTYAHFLAAGATLVAALGLWATRPAGAGLGKEALFVPLMPFLVYFVVVFLGGAEAARQREERRRQERGE